MSTATLQPEGEVLEGEVIETSRRRERNAARVPDLLPPSKDEKLRALSRLTPEQQVEHVTELLVGSHAGLLVAIAAQDLPGIAEAKQKAATIQEITKQLRIGKEMRDHAAEFCRRAERGLGVAIREGQARGEVETDAEMKSRRSHDMIASRERKAGRSINYKVVDRKPRPGDFLDSNERNGSGTAKTGSVYDLTDGVSDAQFNEALAEARSEGNLSRANVARKCKAKVAIDESDPMIDAEVEPPAAEPAPKKRLTKHDSTEMLANINGMLNGIVESLPFIDPTEVDAIANEATIRNIRQSMGAIRKILKDITNG